MHSTLVRGQNVFGFFTTVSFFVGVLIAISGFLSPQAPSAKLRLSNIQVARGRPHYYSTKRQEYAHVKFDLDLDLTTLFNWNTKQVFVYIMATYPATTPGEPDSQAVIWDAILASPFVPAHQNHYTYPRSKGKGKKALAQIGKISLDNHRPKYQITDFTGKIANRTDAVLELGYNVQPWVGVLTWANTNKDFGVWKKVSGSKSKKFDFPPLKSVGKKDDMKTARGAESNRDKFW